MGVVRAGGVHRLQLQDNASDEKAEFSVQSGQPTALPEMVITPLSAKTVATVPKSGDTVTQDT